MRKIFAHVAVLLLVLIGGTALALEQKCSSPTSGKTVTITLPPTR